MFYFQGTVSRADVLFDSTYFITSPVHFEFFGIKVQSYHVPWIILAIQFLCAKVLYNFGKFACHVNIQIISYAIPMTLIMPVTVFGLLEMCDMKNNNPLIFAPSIPCQVWFQCPANDEYMTWLNDYGSWVGIIWFLSSIWITRHIWMPQSKRLASTEQMFGRPYFSGK